MKVILFMAMSANGMIADERGNEEFLSHENWKTFSNFVEELGNFIVGRKTYDAVQDWGERYSFDDFGAAERIVLSQNKDAELLKGYTNANSPAKALEILRRGGFEKAFVIGGSTVNSVFAKEGLLDEVILNIESVVVGKGVHVFAQEDFMLRMTLRGVKQVTADIIQLQYSVQK